MTPAMMTLVIVNWALGLVALLCILIVLVGPLGTIIAALVEGTKQLAPGERRSWKKTKIFGIISALGIIGLIAILVLWGAANYLIRTQGIL